ncbi:DUF4340 domain-containing protein [Granulosicoccus sp. 3-233]|uniref:DUF4340 domain-containing protein n=1 Tax=Granulosicoccus sp. 3-233 TaxID=3417969 RepID=UPI003D344DC5
MALSEQSTDRDARHASSAPLNAWRRTLAASRMLQVLGVILVAQLLLAGGLYWNAGRDAHFVVAEQLLAFDESKADTLRIDSADGALVLSRTDGGWQLEGEPVLPADGSKVDQLLTQLAGLKAGLPVATTAAAREQLDVAEDDFQRHITVLQGDQTLADLYVGTSPGYQRAHVRRAGDVAIVAASLNVYDVPEDVDGWMDRDLLSFDDVSRIETEDFTLSRVDEDWTIEAPQTLVTDHQVAREPLDKLLKSLQELRVTGLAEDMENQDDVLTADAADAVSEDPASGESGESSETEDTSVITWTVTDKGAEPLTLTLSKQGNDVTVERSDWPLTFKSSATVFDALNDIDPAVLLPERPNVDENAEQGSAANETVDSDATASEGAAARSAGQSDATDEGAGDSAPAVMSAE